LFRITDSRELAEDAMQEIFLKLWNRRELFHEIENLNAYLHRMAHNFAYHGFRRMAKEALVLDHLRAGSEKVGVEPEDRLISKEVQGYIHSLVDQLTPQQRRVFLLSREGGLKQEEIAQRLGISLSAVKKHMVDALRFLREEISGKYGSLAIALFVLFDLKFPGV
jgi:RNA polymerase sigma-70 factor (ECF subfamily)